MIDLRLGDCLEVMRGMEDASIDLVVTSPPYDKLRRYEQGASFDFEGVAGELKRLLKKGGVIVWIVGDQTDDGSESGSSFYQALHFKSIGLKLYDTMIFRKLTYVPLTHPRYEQTFEFMFVLSKGKPKAIHLLEDDCVRAGRTWKSTHRLDPQGRGDVLLPKHGDGKPIKPTKIRSNIWSYGTDNKQYSDHPAVFPLQLAIDHILSWSNPGDVVLDPFVGSGTTLEACIETDRDGIGIDISPAYIAIAERRIARVSAQSRFQFTDTLA